MELFINVLNRSITASWIILVVIFLRMIFKNAPRWIYCIMWGIVQIRLLVPITLKSVFSLIPSAQIFDVKNIYERSFEINTGISFIDSFVNNIIGDRYYEGVTVPVGLTKTVVTFFLSLWLIGMTFFIIGTIIKHIQLKQRLKTAVKFKENIWQSEFITSPFVYGIFNYRIYIPFSVEEKELSYMLEHENAHIKRGDPLLKWVSYLSLIFHWYNPLVWISYRMLCNDIEIACDECVIRNMNTCNRKEYAGVLLNNSINKSEVIQNYLFFGKSNIKERIKKIVNYKKVPNFLTIILLVICLFLGICFLTNPTDIISTAL